MKKVAIGVSAVVAVAFGAAFVWKPPANSGDVAGWVQALGSILAIGLAIWLQYEARTEKERQARMLAVAFAGQVLLNFDALQMACRIRDGNRLEVARKGLAKALEIDIELGELGVDYVAMVLTLRTMATTVPSQPTSFLGMPDYGAWEGGFGNLAHDCRGIMRKAGLKPPDKGFSP